MISFKFHLVVGMTLLFALVDSRAGNVSLTASDAKGASSFNSAGQWINGAAPNAANSYVTTNFSLRSPADANAYTFGGHSLSVDSVGRFLLKGPGGAVITVTNLTLNGGLMDYANASGDNGVETLAGNITLNGGTTSYMGALMSETELVTAPIGGTGNLQIGGTSVNGGTDIGTVIFTGMNSYTGTTTVATGTLLVNAPLNNASVTVSNGGTLGGAGIIAPRSGGQISVLSNGALAPGGTSMGTLTVDGSSASGTVLSFASGAGLSFRLNSGFQNDGVSLIHGASGDISFTNNTINFTDLSSGSLSNGLYTLFSADAANVYSGLTLDGNGYITAGLAIGSGLSAYPGTRLCVVGNDIDLEIVTNIPTPPTAQVVVNYAVDEGASMQVASGFLHGISSSYPSQYLIDGVKVTSIRGADHMQAGGYLPSMFDAATHARIAAAGSPALIMGLYYGLGLYYSGNNRPGENGDNFAPWINEVTGVYNDAFTNNYAVYSWIPWNEPDLQWTGSHTTAGYYATHKVAYQTVKALNPNARIEAPETSSFNFNYITAFLNYCKSNNCVPDVISWHELTDGNPPDIESHTLQLKNWMQTNGISPRPFAITEYQGVTYGGTVTYNPAQSVIYIAKLERSVANGLVFGLHSDCNQSGSDPTFKASLGDTADAASSSYPRGSWWVYNAYKDLTGRLIQTTVSGASLMDGLAGLDSVMNRSVILVGNATSSAQVIGLTLTNFNAANFLIRNGNVHVRVEAVGMGATSGIVYSPAVLLDADYPVVNGIVSAVLPSLAPQTACRIYVSSATADAAVITSEAESLPFTVSPGDSAAIVSQAGTSGGQAVTFSANAIGDQISFALNVPVTGVYQLTGHLLAAPTNAMVQLYIDGQACGGPKDEYASAANVFTVNFGNIGLVAGTNLLSFSIVNTNQAVTAANFTAGFDNFTLTQLNTLQTIPGKSADGSRFTLTFDCYADPTLTYQVLATDNLLTNSWAPIWSSTGTQNVAGVVTVQDDPFSSHSVRYLRLKISRP